MNKKAETETQAGLGTTDIIKTHYLTNEKNTIQTVKGQTQNLSTQISFATSLGGGVVPPMTTSIHVIVI